MIGDDYFTAAIGMKLTSQSPNAELGMKQRLCGDESQAHDVFGLNDLKLFREVLAAIFNLAMFGIAVARRSALDGIENVDLFTAEGARFDHFRQELACATDERSARRVLVGAGRLSQETNACTWVALAGDCVMSLAR